MTRRLSVRGLLFRRALCVLLTLAMPAAAATATAQSSGPAAWSEVQNLGRTPNGGGASIAASGSNVYVAWGNGPVFLRRSDDAGATFSAPVPLPGSGIIHETDSIGAEGTDVFVVSFGRAAPARDWCCERELGNLVLNRSTDSGASWEPGVPLTESGGAFRVSIAVSLPYVHVAWSDFRGGRWAIYYRRSIDGGRTWEPERRLVAPGLEEANRPQIAVLGKSVHLVWMDNRDGNGPCYTLPHCTETYYMTSSDAGATWGSARRLTYNQPQKPLLSGRPDIAAFDDGALFITYDQDLKFGHGGVQFGLFSPDGGRTWQAPFRLGNTSAEQTHSAAAALVSDGVVAWFDRRFGSNTEIFVRLSEDSGRSWHDEERVSFTPGESSTPHVALARGFLHLVWLEQRPGGEWDVIYRRRPIKAP